MVHQKNGVGWGGSGLFDTGWKTVKGRPAAESGVCADGVKLAVNVAMSYGNRKKGTRGNIGQNFYRGGT